MYVSIKADGEMRQEGAVGRPVLDVPLLDLPLLGGHAASSHMTPLNSRVLGQLTRAIPPTLR